MRARSPLKQVQTASPLYSADKENALNTVASMAGRKRSIHEVEEGAHASKPFAGRDMHMPPSKVRVTDETTGGVAVCFCLEHDAFVCHVRHVADL
jgi:hypothetical protein